MRPRSTSAGSRPTNIGRWSRPATRRTRAEREQRSQTATAPEARTEARVRGSLKAVPKGQWETTTALSMSYPTALRRVIWPQAWVLMLSGYNNLLVMLIKGTAVALFIGLQDLAYEIDQLRINTTTIFAYGIGLIIYYLFALVFSSGLRQLEKRARRRLGLPTRSAHAGAGVAL